MERLSTAADAASRTCHYLYGMVLVPAVPDVFKQMACIAEPVGYAYLQLKSVQIHRSPPDSVHSPDSLEIDTSECLAGIKLVNCPQGGLHHSSCCSENHSCPGGRTQRKVEFHVREKSEAYVGPLDQACKFPGRYGIVHIRIPVSAELLAVTFIFLCKTRHYGHHHQLFTRYAHLLGPPCLGYGAEHLLRRPCSGRYVEKVRELVLEEIDPCRTARCQYRQTHAPVTVQVLRQPLEHLGAFLHYGQVGSEISVEHVVETELPQGRHHLAGDKCPGRQAELLSYRRPHRRSGLHDDDLPWISKVLHEPVGVVSLRERAHGAHCHALPAVSTLAFRHHPVESRCDGGVESSPDGTERTYCLDFVAHAFTPAAENAFVHVADNGRRHLPLTWRKLASVEWHFPDIETQGEILQFAVPCLRTGKAFVRVV